MVLRLINLINKEWMDKGLAAEDREVAAIKDQVKISVPPNRTDIFQIREKGKDKIYSRIDKLQNTLPAVHQWCN